ncbi:MAG: Radical SAM superfamily protein [Candidatus Omnitrophica bacterium ADurb.Bin277]|nr:MAG: Radical SAM superfamily protein [Candidatus Omnitrophica bacterium ADurb.Bin277]
MVKYKKLRFYIIKPSKYDDDGYVIRYWKGVLPNNTLACLYALTKDVKERGILGEDLKWEITLIDDTVQRPPYGKIMRHARDKDAKTLVCLAGVQSNQFPRAEDIALKLRAAGADVLIGGFHVSGVMATLPELSPELQRLQDAGVILVAGEGEGGHWEMLLHDALNDNLRPVYNFLGDLPDLSDAPIPEVPPGTMKHYALSHYGTLDCGRGCPFGCSFCTVINVQGRKMRYRNVDKILARIRENFHKYGITNYFFTDDNFCRNKNWEAIMDGLIEMREKENIKIHYLMQIDTQSHKVPMFVKKAARSGCQSVFIGMESLNEENLISVQKTQNKTSEFRELVDVFHSVGIVTHLSYIIGFPFDTVESVKKDVDRLVSFGSGQTSFFMMTPLPGAVDYKTALEKKMLRDADLNNYDTFHETHRHARMNPGEWLKAYEDAWHRFYSVENMKSILKNIGREPYWGVFANFVWYKNGFTVEGGHPMLHGFFRLKGRSERRSGFPKEKLGDYLLRRVNDIRHLLKGWWRLSWELCEVWLATHERDSADQKIATVLEETPQRHWKDYSLEKLRELYRKAGLRVPSGFSLWLSKVNLFWDNYTPTRVPFAAFWRDTGSKFRHNKFFEVDYLRLLKVLTQDCAIFVRFLFTVITCDIRSEIKPKESS